MPLPRIDSILKLPLYQRLLLLGVVWLIIAGAFYYFLYSAKLTEINSLNARLEGLKIEVAKKSALASDLPRIKKEMEELKVQFQKALEQLPDEKEIANLLDSISGAARGARLEILTFKPGRETPKGFYAEVTVDMKVEGGYSGLMTFFNKVAELPRIVNIGTLNITSGKEVRGDIMLATTFIVTTFKFIPQPAEAKK